MAKLARKVEVGIGAATIAAAPLAVNAAAQARHKAHAQPAPSAGKDAAAANPDQCGEAYLKEGPRDGRIRFYRDIALMRGHILVGGELIELGLWDEALPH